MFSLKGVFFVLVLSLQVAVGADKVLAQRDAVYDFIKTNLQGKAVGSHSIMKSEIARLEYDFKRRIYYTNVVKTPEGLHFDEVIEIKQLNYDLDEKFNRIPDRKPINQDRILVIRVFVRQLNSTGKLVGFTQVISNTNQKTDSVASSDTVSDLRVEGGALIGKRITGVYADHFAAEGKYEAGRSEQSLKIQVIDGKIDSNITVTTYRVNPETLEPTSAKDISVMHETEE